MKTVSADPAVAHQRREQRIMLLLASPAILVIVVLLVLPLSWLFWQSIYADGFTFEHYRRILTEDIYRTTFFLTFRISVVVTLLALALGYPVAYAAAAAAALVDDRTGDGDIAVLDQCPGARLCLADPAAAQWPGQ